jgi:microcystin-dependent protein
MAQPYIGEIRMFAGNFAPVGWMLCGGQQIAISENETLFNLIGTTYGGDGQETFGLPDLRGRVPIHQSNDFILAQSGGVEQVTLTVAHLPAHNHPLLASDNIATDANPSLNVLGQTSTFDLYQSQAGGNPMAPKSISFVGGGQPHTNYQPYLCVNFIISLFGIFPSEG